MDQFLMRLLDELEGIHSELEQLRVLKEHKLGVRVEHAEGGHGPYVPKDSAEE
jgi:hypothetical protein